MRTSIARRMTALLGILLIAALGCQGAPAATEATSLSSSSTTLTRSAGQDGLPSVIPSLTTTTTCPEDTIEVGDLLPMSPIERLVCLEDRPITLDAYIPWQEHVCGETGIKPSWLGECLEVIDLHDEASDFSADLPARVHPSTGLQAHTLSQQLWVRVTGHYDDPAALTCRQTPQPGTVAEPVEATILECRRQFVITALTEVAAP